MSIRLDTIGRYHLLEPVGHGGMAIVYRGQDDQLGRPVAIKLLADNLAGDESFRRRFLREARLAAQLQHPNIVHVYDTGQDDGRPYIVMEYIEGETLADLLAREGHLEPRRALELTIQACAGLEHAHGAGLVHRDVKPQNLLLREDGIVKIADFGIARSAHGTRLTEIGSVLGTAAYLAPEQAAGEDVTAAADIYALGVVLYQMLAGRPPYSYESLTKLLVAQNEQVVPPLRDHAAAVTDELEEVVMRCLARLPEYRPPSARALAEALAATAAELPTRPLPQPGSEVTRTKTLTSRVGQAPTAISARSSFRRQHRALLIAAVAVVGIAILIAAAGGNEKPSPVQRSDTPALEQAQDLSQWLRARTP